MTAAGVRAERSFESYSRGADLVRAIRRMVEANRSARWELVDGRWSPPSAVINPRIGAIVAEHDLTVTEWHYWCRIAMAAP